MSHEILLANNFVALPKAELKKFSSFKEVNSNVVQVATIISNMAYYGYMPSMEVIDQLNSLSNKKLIDFWKEINPVFEKITGANRKMGDFVVYKNFPKEVLSMSETEYWVKQVFMYFGLPNEIFTEDLEDRKPMEELTSLKVLALADENTSSIIFKSLLNNKSRWSDNQLAYAKDLLKSLKVENLNVDDFSFKENGITLAIELINLGKMDVAVSTATDTLRLAAGMSGMDISLREKPKFKKFSRPERKFLLERLENSNNLSDDMALRKEVFKRLFKNLHPGDYKFEKVKAAYNDLYNNNLTTFNSKVESFILSKDKAVLNLLEGRPGDLVRRFHKLANVFGEKVIPVLQSVSPRLETVQLLKLDKYLSTINNRQTLIFPPKGNWTKAQVKYNDKEKLSDTLVAHAKEVLSKELSLRMESVFPEGVVLDPKLLEIKLQTNDQKLAEYGRGTEFDIPKTMNFIRTASYWEHNSGYGNSWFDNGWNFFDVNWNPQGTICWNSTHGTNGAVFSGDPTNSKDLQGRACQMIDLDLNALEKQGIHYAVWNILSYSRVKFSDAKEVLGTLQWGEKAQEGALYEPARAQMVFPITGDNLTKYVAYIDVKARKLVYMDANLYGQVSSATGNIHILSQMMPAFKEYLDSLPSIGDLVAHAKEGNTPVLYSDKEFEIEKDTKAFVFRPENPENSYEKLSVSDMLASIENAPKKQTKKGPRI